MVTIMSITMMVMMVVGVVMPVHLIILCIRLVKYSYISRDRYYDLITRSPILTIPTTEENSEKVLRRDIGLKPSTVLV